MKHKHSFALITGASQGLGKAFSKELAEQGYNLLLSALPGEGLEAWARLLCEQYQITALLHETDLAQSSAQIDLANWASAYPVQVVINNAGIGGTMPYESATTDYLNRIIQVNVTAPAILINRLLPVLKEHEQAYVLNVSSMAAFSPMAYKTVYPASKAFVWSFSRGLYQELREQGIFVGVVHPGPIKTNPDVCRRIEKQKLFGRLGLVSPDRLAKVAIRQLFNQDPLLIPGILNKVNWAMMKIVPIWIRMGVLAKVVQREIDEPKEYILS